MGVFKGRIRKGACLSYKKYTSRRYNHKKLYSAAKKSFSMKYFKPLKRSTPYQSKANKTLFCHKRKSVSGKKVRTPYKSPLTKKPRTLSPFTRHHMSLVSPILYSKSQTPRKSRRILKYNEKTVNNHLIESFHNETDTHINGNDMDETILYSDDDISDSTFNTVDNKQNFEAISSMPDDDVAIFYEAIDRLREHNLNEELISFLTLVAQGQFPLDNVAFLSFIDVVKWFNCEDVRSMRDSDTIKKFFWLGKKLFGSRFIRFMSGPKNETDVLLGKQNLSPLNSKVNFACPGEPVLRNYNPLGYDICVDSKPGIIQEMIDLTARNNAENISYVLMFDGKKIKRGTDIDLLGFESEPASERKEKFQQDMVVIQNTLKCLQEIDRSLENEQVVNANNKQELFAFLISCFKIFSVYLMELRKLRKTKENAMKNYKEKIRKDPSLSKTLEYAMDCCRTATYQIDNCVSQLLKTQFEICRTGAYVNGVLHLFATSRSVDLTSQENVNLLKSVKEMKEDLNTEELPTACVKQRSEEWFNARKKVKVTGSTVYSAVGCDGLKALNNHIDKVCNKDKNTVPPESQVKAMEHGIACEEHEIATLASVIMPFLYPYMTYNEEGYYLENGIIVSPDGSLRDETGNTLVYAFEGKAPVGNDFTVKQHYKVPERYITQTLFEQKVLKATKGTLYLCWTEESTTVFIVPSSEAICEMCEDIISHIYTPQEPKRQTRLSNESKELKEVLKRHVSECTFVGEFPSVKSQINLSVQQQEYAEDFSYSDLVRSLLKAQASTKDVYNLQRKFASQVIVYLLADLDRMWKSELPHAVPVMYCYRGYSLPMDKARALTEHCRQTCKNKGLDIVATASDGEFNPLMVKGKDEAPLTMFQLSKTVWKDVCNMKRGELLKELRSLNVEYVKTTGENESITLKSADGASSIKTSAIGWSQKLKRYSKQQIQLKDQSVEPEINLRENARVIVNSSNHETVTSVTDKAINQIDMDIYTNTDTLPVNESIEMFENEVDVDPAEDSDVDRSLPYNFEDLLEETNSREQTQNIPMPSSDAKEILKLFCEIKPHRWNNKTAKELLEIIQTSLKTLFKEELIVLINYFNLKFASSDKIVNISKALKADLLKLVASFLGVEVITELPRKKHRHISTLRDKAAACLMKNTYPKQALNIAYATYIWPKKVEEWRQRNKVAERIIIKGKQRDLFFEPYSVPEYRETEDDFSVFVYDKTHLGTNLRKCICLDKVKGISIKAWKSVSLSNPDILHPTLIEVSSEGKILDQMKETLARTIISEEVESIMIRQGYNKEAEFCRVVREGLYVADDTPGVPAFERCEKRLALMEWLSRDVDFGSFPPYGGYIKGLSHILYEGLRMSQEAKLYIYTLAKAGTYCVRAPNTLCSESFFGTMQDMDPWGQGILSASGVQKHLVEFATITAMKMEDKRLVRNIG